jgi:hypothetical protein
MRTDETQDKVVVVRDSAGNILSVWETGLESYVRRKVDGVIAVERHIVFKRHPWVARVAEIDSHEYKVRN